MAIVPDFTSRVALVTGGSRGIGRAVALGLAEAGADVAVNYREQTNAAEAVVAAIRAMGRRAIAVKADMASPSAITDMFARVSKELGAPLVLVNNAATAPRRGLDELTEADFDETIRVNLKGPFLCTQAALPAMRREQWGRIVNITSGAARGAGSIGLHYNASKAGLEGLTRGYAARLVKEGITVNAVAPSLIATHIMPPENAARVPMGRLGTAEEVAQAVLMVIGNAYMTGQTVALSGGLAFI